MGNVKILSCWYSLKGAFFNLKEKLTGYRSEKRIFKELVGYELDLENPISYNQKIVWKKLYDRNPLLPVVADKYRVRQHLKEVLGEKEAEKVLIPLLYVTDRPETIPFDDFPPEYVIKANSGSGRNIIVEKNSPADRKLIIAQCREWLSKPYDIRSHEWAHNKIKRNILIEKLLRDENGKIPIDYKFLMFHGKCREVQVIYERFGDTSTGWYAPEWKYLDIKGTGQWEKTADYMEKPPQLNSMTALAEALSAPFDLIRVDLYLVNNRIYFGELTNYPASGMDLLDPVSHDFDLGKKWKLIPRYWEHKNHSL